METVTPQTRLSEADAALDSDPDRAEGLYNTVAQEAGAGTPEYRRALDGIKQARQRKRNVPASAAGVPTGRLPELPESDSVADPDAEAPAISLEDAARVQQRIAELLAEAELFQSSRSITGYDRALALLDRVLGFSDVSAEQRREIERRRDEAAAARAALDSTSSAQAETPPEALSPAPSHSDAVQQQVQQRVQQLAGEAQGYLARRTAANYKRALGLYERILGFSDISAEQRAVFLRQLNEVQRDYGGFRAQFGELTTARQIQAEEYELIELRKQTNAGEKIGPDGEELDAREAEFLVRVRDKLLRVARERVAQADRQVAEGMAYLEEQQLDAAIKNYERAVQLIQGAELETTYIEMRKRVGAELVSNLSMGSGIEAKNEIDVGSMLPVDAKVAIESIRSVLQSNEVQTKIQEYQARIEDIQKDRDSILRIRPLYAQAYQAFQEGANAHAVDILDSTRANAGQRLRSALLEDLRDRALQRWEEATLPQAEQLLEDARIALSRGEGRAEQLLSSLLGLEPHLPSEKLAARKEQGRKLLEGLRESEQQATTLIQKSNEARRRRDLAEAERLARQALALRPHYQRALQTLDSALDAMINAALQQADATLGTPTQQSLQASRNAIERQRPLVSEINNIARRKQLGDQIEEMLVQIKRGAERLSKATADAQRAQDLIDEVRNLIVGDDYEKALECLMQARDLMPQDPQVGALEAEIYDAWARFLKRRAREYLDATPPNPAVALTFLDKLRSNKIEDAPSIDLRLRAEQLAAKERSITLLQQGDFGAAIETLTHADFKDPEVRGTLREARRKEAQRLLTLQQWSKALQVLQQIESADQVAGFAGLLSRARAEVCLHEAVTLLRAKQFDDAEAQLDLAKNEPLADLPDRIKDLRQQIERASIVFREVEALYQQAQQQYRGYQASDNRDDLLAAIRMLDKTLAHQGLPASDSQRDEIQKRRDDYQRQYQRVVADERARFLAAGDQALAEERPADALRNYTTALELAPNHQDAEVTTRLDQTRTKLRQMRDKLVDKAQDLLNTRGSRAGQRGIRLTEVEALTVELERAQQIDREPHPALNQALLDTQEALRACHAAETDLRAARIHWATARQAGVSQFRGVENDLQRAIRHFDGRTYIHVELDRNSPESLSQRIDADREAQRVIGASRVAIQSALTRNDTDAVDAGFAEMARAEETVYSTTVMLAERVPTLSVPRTIAERYANQQAFLRLITDEIEQLLQQEREVSTISALCELARRRNTHQRLMERLDRDNRFGLLVAEAGLPLNQLESWDRTISEGSQMLQEATRTELKAKEDQSAKRWRVAAEGFRQAHKAYAGAVERLTVIAGMAESSLQALKTLRANAQQSLTQAQAAIQTLDSSRDAELCEQQVNEARELLLQADTALREQNYVTARVLADQAREQDPLLQLDAERIVRAVAEFEHDRGGSRRWVIALVVIVALVALGVLLWPLLSTWINSFLYPEQAFISPIVR